ncbi:MAG: ABC transporter permease subunit [Chloroflexota bacterium]
MNPHLYLSNLKSSRVGIITWSILIALYGLLVMYLYPAMKNATGIAEYIQNLPEPLKEAIGITQLLTPEGIYPLKSFVAVEFLAWAPVFVAIYAIFAAGNIAAKEVEMGTMDLLLSLPVSRTRLLASKFAVFITGLLAIQAASMAGLAIGMYLIEDRMSLASLALALVQASLLVLAVGSYSLLFSCIFLNPRKTLTVSGTLTVVLYILNFMAPSLGSYQWVRRLSLFHYYRTEAVINSASLDWGGVAVFLVVIAVCLASAMLIFRRRDITP